MDSPTPYAEAHRRLHDIHLQRQARSHAQRTLEAITRQLAEAQAQHKQLTEALWREGREVTRLERPSFAALVAALRGTRDSDLAREREEALAAQIAVDASAATVAALEAEAVELTKRVAGYGDLDAAYAAALHAKEAALLASDHPGTAQLRTLDAAITTCEATVQELDEALAAGTAAGESLQAVRGALESAEGWGTWDMLGGGMLATAVKHQRIDEARAAAHTAGRRLRRFQAELGDVQLDSDPGGLGAIDTLATVGDYLFDGLFVDWFVQAKIQRALDQTWKVQLAVRNLLAALEERRQTLGREQADLAAQRQTLIANV